MTLAHHCPTCTCEAPDLAERPWREHPVVEVSGGRSFCPASATVGKQGLSCLEPGHHDGPHRDRIIDPCPECGAWDEHTDWCKLCEWSNLVWSIETVIGNRIRVNDSYDHEIRFEQEGPFVEPVYWVKVAA